MTALIVGTALALGGLGFVLWPLLAAHPSPGPSGRAETAGIAASTDSAIEVLREIEFDHATGKLSDADFSELRARYLPFAAAELRGANAGAGVCPVCGPRPESEALFCSSCGRRLTP